MKKTIVMTLLMAAAVSAQAATARLQVIHNSADPAAEIVDIYVNGDLFIDDFTFRDATAFQTVPAGVQLDIGVAPSSSGSSDDVIATIPVTLQAHRAHVKSCVNWFFKQRPFRSDCSLF